MIKRICKQCGKEYETYPSIKLLFCSYRCSNEWRKGKTWFELYENAEEMFKNIKGVRKSIATEFKSGWQHTKEGKEIIKKARKTLGNKNCTKTEEITKKILKENNFPFNFVGDGSLIIGTKNPDFVYSKEGKKIIEVFGDYWHRDDIVKYWHQTEEGCKIYYEAFGYNVLIIWEKELRSPNKVAKKIREFINTTLEFDIPEKTKKRFLDLANEEFDGDIGMCLKFIIDDIPSQDTRMIIAKLEEIESRLHILESSKPKSEEVPDENVRKMLDGTKRRLKGGRK